ncbi:hypothetical protein ACQY0O_007752 [Thecaphora frezii]
MSGFLTSSAVLLGRSVLSPVAPHSLFAVNIEHARADAAAASTETPDANAIPTVQSLLASCPSLDPARKPTFKPTPWLTTGHLQTIYCAVGSFDHIDPVQYRRRVFLTPDGGTVSLDISPPALAPSEAELQSTDTAAAAGVPTVVCLHGLTGGSHESYVRNCFSRLTAPKSEGGAGYRGVVVNFRGCASTPVTSPQLYSASKTSDLRSALLLLTQLYPKSPMVGIGFSLGANVLGKYLGEEGDDSPLLAGIIVGTPFDLKAGSDALEYGGFLPQKYSSVMNLNLTRVVRRHKDTLALHPPLRPFIDRLYDPEPLSKEDEQLHKRQCKAGGPKPGEREIIRPGTLKLVDETMVRLMGGHSKPYGEFPFASANDYYTHGGCANFLRGVKRPLLCLNAEDDPIVPASIWDEVRRTIGYDGRGQRLPASERPEAVNDHVALAWTKAGGHLGWFEGIRPKRWLYKPVNEFIHAVFEQTSDEVKQRIAKAHLWKHEGRVIAKEVDVELMPKEALPIYDLPGENGRPKRSHGTSTSDSEAGEAPRANDHREGGEGSEARVAHIAEELEHDHPVAEEALLNPSDTGMLPSRSDSAVDGTDVAPHQGSRLAWLLTRVLPEAPLVHPRDAAWGDYAASRPGADEAARAARGWEVRKRLTMYCDTQRPEVGFLELEPETRVGGAGEVFRGGIETPGERLDAVKAAGKKKQDVVAGL